MRCQAPDQAAEFFALYFQEAHSGGKAERPALEVKKDPKARKALRDRVFAQCCELL